MELRNVCRDAVNEVVTMCDSFTSIVALQLYGELKDCSRATAMKIAGSTMALLPPIVYLGTNSRILTVVTVVYCAVVAAKLYGQFKNAVTPQSLERNVPVGMNRQ